MRFRFGRARGPKAVNAVVTAAPAGAAPETVTEPTPAGQSQQPTNDPRPAAELSPEKLDQALKRLRTEIPATDDDGSR